MFNPSLCNSADIAQNHRWNWSYLCKKQTQSRKAILFRAKIMVKNEP